MTLTLDGLWSIATDERGRSYRVLQTTGQPPAYRLQPIGAGYRARTVVEGQPDFAAIAAAEQARIAAFRAGAART